MNKTIIKRFLGMDQKNTISILAVLFFSMGLFLNVNAQLGPNSLPLLKSKSEAKVLIDQKLIQLFDLINQSGATKGDASIAKLVTEQSIWFQLGATIHDAPTMRDVAYNTYATANFGIPSSQASNTSYRNSVIPEGISLSAWNQAFFAIIDELKN